jgi:hypothetical protein
MPSRFSLLLLLLLLCHEYPRAVTLGLAGGRELAHDPLHSRRLWAGTAALARHWVPGAEQTGEPPVVLTPVSPLLGSTRWPVTVSFQIFVILAIGVCVCVYVCS